MKTLIYGYTAAIGYVATTIFSLFFVETLLSEFENKFVVIFFACLSSTIFFTVISLKSVINTYVSTFRSWKIYLILSVLIGSNWLCSVFGVTYSNAFLYGLGYYILSTALAYLDVYIRNRNSKTLVIFLFACVILVIALFENLQQIHGFLIALLGGATGYLYRIATHSFSQDEKLSSTQILSVRFFPLIILLTTKFHFIELYTLSIHKIYIILIFSTVAFIIPNYLNQVGIIYLGANKSTLTAAFIFPISWLIEHVLHKNLVINTNLFLAIASMIIVLLQFSAKHKNL